MARLERPTTESRNPATKFIEWKSDEKCFSYYDKENKENVKIELPFKFLFLEHYHTVKGWHDASQSGIYSNEVYSIGNTEMTVKAFKGGEIASGLYKDIKPKVNSAGGNYHRSIYAMLEDGSIVNIALKGASIGGIKKEKAKSGKDEKGYSDFYNDVSHLTDNQWIEVNEAKEGKSGKIEYSIPSFSIGKQINKETDTLANHAASELQLYMNSYLEPQKEDGFREKSTVEEYNRKNEKVDDLDF